MFKYQRLKLACEYQTCPWISSHQLLEESKEWTSTFIDEGHSVLGEEVGIKREWKSNYFENSELINVCSYALNQMGTLVQDFCKIYDCDFVWQSFETNDRYTILLETDLDPTLPEKWGW